MQGARSVQHRETQVQASRIKVPAVSAVPVELEVAAPVEPEVMAAVVEVEAVVEVVAP